MKKISYILPLAFTLLFISCEREIEVELPPVEEKLVIEGFIEQGVPPLVFLTRSMGYFEPTDINTLQNIIVRDATVSISTNGTAIELELYCISQLPPTLLPMISELSGLPVAQLISFNYCFYTTLNPDYFGKIGSSYALEVNHKNEEYTSFTTIPQPVPVDSLWFIKREQAKPEGLVWLKFTDPANRYNAYRVYSKRLGKDGNFTPVSGSVFEDKFFDGKPVEFYFYPGRRGQEEFSNLLVVEGDTVVIKFCSIDEGVFRFLRDFETSIVSNGNPFAAPSTISSNIKGGALGYWGGYGVTYDTLVAKK
ncbi:MAG: DUF4249 domain-containing protein [Bacteroidetes bacterium]|nr:DUF4249 domain-containing protein [Bacteroidota bacterium]